MYGTWGRRDSFSWTPTLAPYRRRGVSLGPLDSVLVDSSKSPENIDFLVSYKSLTLNDVQCKFRQVTTTFGEEKKSRVSVVS